ncbi:hypothetical protein PANDA_014482 [Ailuropoda melanoleuca]|uniref:Uncharacterized protein n=1 Tax=Ailuropoda melanoleuca TaxID=9646 RepID=D2HR87_AILME|nr:hypothetical protein PANDA_014482 [Ailuropoda melanoleuca]
MKRAQNICLSALLPCVCAASLVLSESTTVSFRRSKEEHPSWPRDLNLGHGCSMNAQSLLERSASRLSPGETFHCIANDQSMTLKSWKQLDTTERANEHTNLNETILSYYTQLIKQLIYDTNYFTHRTGTATQKADGTVIANRLEKECTADTEPILQPRETELWLEQLLSSGVMQLYPEGVYFFKKSAALGKQGASGEHMSTYSPGRTPAGPELQEEMCTALVKSTGKGLHSGSYAFHHKGSGHNFITFMGCLEKGQRDISRPGLKVTPVPMISAQLMLHHKINKNMENMQTMWGQSLLCTTAKTAS